MIFMRRPLTLSFIGHIRAYQAFPERRHHLQLRTVLQRESTSLASNREPSDSCIRTQIIRMPLILLPIVIASATDALVALRRIGAFMRAEELSVPYEIDANAESAIDVEGDFTWETVRKDANAINLAAKFGKGKKGGKGTGKKSGKKGNDSLLPTAVNTPAGTSPARSTENVVEAGVSGEVKDTEKEKEKPFELKGIELKIPKGSFVAIVGRVGSGKVRSSLVFPFFPGLTCARYCRVPCFRPSSAR